jgi:hypothetical protein
MNSLPDFFSRRQIAAALLLVLGVFLTAIAMESRWLDPTRSNPFHTGAVLSVLWSAGLLSWALRATRSHQSRFGLSTIFGITLIVAIGFANIFVAIAIVCCAMTLDVGVRRSDSTHGFKWRCLQAAAGVTGMAHAARMIYYSVPQMR